MCVLAQQNECYTHRTYINTFTFIELLAKLTAAVATTKDYKTNSPQTVQWQQLYLHKLLAAFHTVHMYVHRVGKTCFDTSAVSTTHCASLFNGGFCAWTFLTLGAFHPHHSGLYPLVIFSSYWCRASPLLDLHSWLLWDSLHNSSTLDIFRRNQFSGWFSLLCANTGNVCVCVFFFPKMPLAE